MAASLNLDHFTSPRPTATRRGQVEPRIASHEPAATMAAGLESLEVAPAGRHTPMSGRATDREKRRAIPLKGSRMDDGRGDANSRTPS